VLIIGAGPAGLTAALYAGRALLDTVLIEKAIPGGQLNETDLIENWPGFEDAVAAPALMQSLRKQAERFGSTIIQDEVIRIEPGDSIHTVVTPRETYQGRVLILSPGSRPRPLPAAGADRLKGKGISYCATCDGFFFQGKHILEVGAGDSGLTEALFLTRFVESIAIVVRHPEDDPKAFRASAILRERALKHPKIRFLWNCVIEEALGEDRLTGVESEIWPPARREPSRPTASSSTSGTIRRQSSCKGSSRSTSKVTSTRTTSFTPRFLAFWPREMLASLPTSTHKVWSPPVRGPSRRSKQRSTSRDDAATEGQDRLSDRRPKGGG